VQKYDKIFLFLQIVDLTTNNVKQTNIDYEKDFSFVCSGRYGSRRSFGSGHQQGYRTCQQW
jgi:hypothetical protein